MLQRLSSKLVKHGSELLSSVLDKLRVDVNAVTAKADATATTVDENMEQIKADIADLKKRPGKSIGERFWWDYRSELPEGTIPLDGQTVPITGIYEPLYLAVKAGKHPKTDHDTWHSSGVWRGAYVLYEDQGLMRVPDMNGAQVGSRVGSVARGDGGGNLTCGHIQAAAVPNISGSFQYSATQVNAARSMGAITDATDGNLFEVTNGTGNAGIWVKSNVNYQKYKVNMNASRHSDVYKDGVDEVRMVSSVGCWVVQVFSGASPSGEFDPMTLASQIAKLQTAVTRLDDSFGIAQIDCGQVTKGTSTVFTNPFGANTPVACQAKYFNTTLNKWVYTEWIYAGSNQSWGLNAWYREGEGVNVVVGNQGFSSTMANSGTSENVTSNYTAATAHVIVEVRKITNANIPVFQGEVVSVNYDPSIGSMELDDNDYVDTMKEAR